MNALSFRTEFGADLKDVDQAEKKDFPAIEQWIRKLPAGTSVTFDLSDIEFIGYSYAKQTIRRCLKDMIEGKYGQRAFILRYAGENHLSKLTEVSYALNENNLTMLVSTGTEGQYALIGYLTCEGLRESIKEKRKKRKLLNMLEMIISQKEAFTNDIAKTLGLSLQNCNHLLDELEQVRLIEREKQISPTGGPLYLNRLIAP